MDEFRIISASVSRPFLNMDEKYSGNNFDDFGKHGTDGQTDGSTLPVKEMLVASINEEKKKK